MLNAKSACRKLQADFFVKIPTNGDRGDGKRKIYEDLNFTVEPGRIVGLLGKNGTGMSRKGSVDIVEMASNTLREEKTRL